ncbi:hypothetical protein [Vibrio campbellii]|uniref:hypothetical protein n=1 Tax=Vibrio campbellii TaxID=680 RepID=UPI00210E0BCA|nr:hypothetical protein [Vibrio campbellii]UTZ42776.1 hypothetical protein HB764_15645 [Vibrio campbellii]
MKVIDKLESFSRNNALSIISGLVVVLLFVVFLPHFNQVFDWIRSVWLSLTTPKQDSTYQSEHYYFVINTLMPLGMFLLTIVSVLFVRQSIIENTKQRKLESVDKLIRDSVLELKEILQSRVLLPEIIAEVLEDKYSEKSQEWDINKVIIQVNAFIAISESIPNRRLVQAVSSCLKSHHFHYNSFNAAMELKNQYSLLIDLILRRQKLERDIEYNEVTLKFCDYLLPVLQWCAEDKEEIDELSERVKKVSAVYEDGLQVRLNASIGVVKFDYDYKKFDNLSCKDILEYKSKG